MNQTSTKSPIAAAMLDMINTRLAKLSTANRSPDGKPNTRVDTMSTLVSLRDKNHLVACLVDAAMTCQQMIQKESEKVVQVTTGGQHI